MARRWPVFLVLLGLYAGCKGKAQPPTGADASPGVASAEQPAAEQDGVAPPARDEVDRAESRRNAARADETAQRATTAEAAAEQQRAPAKVRGARLHQRAPAGGPSSGKVQAAHQESQAQAEVRGGPAHAALYFKNEAGETFRLVDARFVMDGAELPTVIKAAERGKSYAVFSGDLHPGHHVVTTHLMYQGANHGVFSYMNDYAFKVESDEVLTTDSGQAASFTIVCKERTGFNEPVDKRLVVTVVGHRDP
jgi:hypothetical protein